MKRILICGLPGSGKTTLAKRLVEILGDADWYNADEIREKFNDWDFTPEGRERQMKRMQDYVRKSVAKHRYGIADFVCPTNELREKFMPEYVIWMNTIAEGRFEDTNKMFEKPEGLVNSVINEDEWWTEDAIEEWARLLAVDIRDSEFQPKLPVTQMLGRFQPWHEGHQKLFERALAKHGQVAVMVRDMPITEDNPWQVDVICKNVELALAEFAGKFRVYSVPNIMNITYGRGVGYKIEEEVLDEETQKISATKIREQMRKDGEL
jgi:phosphopantetheine adenylyltransferase